MLSGICTLKGMICFTVCTFWQNIHMPAPDFHACAGQLHVADSEKTPVWEFLWKHPWYFLIYISAALWFAAAGMKQHFLRHSRITWNTWIPVIIRNIHRTRLSCLTGCNMPGWQERYADTAGNSWGNYTSIRSWSVAQDGR